LAPQLIEFETLGPRAILTAALSPNIGKSGDYTHY
jgi:hypothetical protein